MTRQRGSVGDTRDQCRLRRPHHRLRAHLGDGQGHFTVENKPKYWGASGGLEYEAAWALGSDTGVDDLETLTYANYLRNEDAMDPISFGAAVAAAMELYETGAIDDSVTGGVKLNFGSAEALAKAAEMTAPGEGFGKDLGLGSKRLCEKYGRPSSR